MSCYRHRAILSYLSNANLLSSYAALREELDALSSSDRPPTVTINGDDDQRYKGLLEKKWTSVIRLQKKVKSP
jgi:platelet-activating factor acetylhydrolase IB subunit alpha